MDVALATRSHGAQSIAGERLGRQASRQAPQQAFYILGKLLRLLSVYALFKYLDNRDASITVLMFICLLVSGLALLILQRPWRGRPLSASQIYPTLLNGGVLAVAMVCWGRSLVICGPVRTVLAEYTGAVLGAATTLALGRGRGGFKWRKVGGLAAMLFAFYLLSKGWAMATFSPFSHSSDSRETDVGVSSMSMSIIAGILLALRRVIARRVSTKSPMKKRLHALTVASAPCFLFPVAMFQLTLGEAPAKSEPRDGSLVWAYFSMITFGILMAFYVDTYAEDRLHIQASSPVHFVVTSALLVLLELLHQMDFSLVGFLICSSILGIGIFEVTTSESLPPEIIMTTGPSTVS